MALISVIIPVFNEEENIPALYVKLKSIAGGSGHDFEIIFVDDCSTDRSFPLLNELSAKDRRLKVIRFSRNFGSHAACLAGLMSSKGAACAFISADMQEPPELVNLFIEQWEKGYEVVMGVRE